MGNIISVSMVVAAFVMCVAGSRKHQIDARTEQSIILWLIALILAINL